MTCLGCGVDAGFNRAVVDGLNGRCVGGLCVGCEERAFGAMLRLTERVGGGCAFCPRDGSYALPEWTPFAEEGDDGSLAAHVDYEVGDATVHLCDRHLRLIEENAGAAVRSNATATRSHR